MKGTSKLVLIILCCVVSPVFAQAPAKKKVPTVQELQQQIIELQGKLLECQGTGGKGAASNPMSEALEAFQTFNSTVDTGVNQSAYKAALVPLKVKVDKLPDNEQTAPMKKTLEMLVDAGSLWNISIANSESMRGLAVPMGYVTSFIAKYTDEWQAVDRAKRGGPNGLACVPPTPADWQKYYAQRGEQVPQNVWSDCVKDLGMALIHKGQENIKQKFVNVAAGTPGPAKAAVPATQNKDCTPRYYRGGLDNPCPDPNASPAAAPFSQENAGPAKSWCLIDGKWQPCPTGQGITSATPAKLPCMIDGLKEQCCQTGGKWIKCQ